jgi:hypothetical protein
MTRSVGEFENKIYENLIAQPDRVPRRLVSDRTCSLPWRMRNAGEVRRGSHPLECQTVKRSLNSMGSSSRTMNEQSPKSPTWQLATRRRFGNGAIGVQARLPDGHALSSWACDNDSELGLSFREASHDAGWPALANVRSKALLLALTAFESSRPVDRDHANKGERHSEFRLDVRQELSNPLRGVSLPIDDGRIAMCKISVNPEGGPQQRDDMPDDRCLAHDFTRFQERRSAHQHVTPL